MSKFQGKTYAYYLEHYSAEEASKKLPSGAVIELRQQAWEDAIESWFETAKKNAFQKGETIKPVAPSGKDKDRKREAPSGTRVANKRVKKAGLKTTGLEDEDNDVPLTERKDKTYTPGPPAPFKEGQQVCYSKGGVASMAIILEIHFDNELEPFFTIFLVNEMREKQTDRHHLSVV